jgi:DMSO/TMAO reductase YedYZ molybdopterin-dependent catalytic subunit
VSFVSATGYRWSVPLSEARSLMLATHVGGVALDHGHGAPLRLVAPGRRGFQWVKWVREVRVMEGEDLGQWAVIFTSGL